MYHIARQVNAARKRAVVDAGRRRQFARVREVLPAETRVVRFLPTVARTVARTLARTFARTSLFGEWHQWKPRSARDDKVGEHEGKEDEVGCRAAWVKADTVI
jgi:hypothetical protein